MVHHNNCIPPLVGRTIGEGRLTVLSVLGSGSNGVIFLAEGRIAIDRAHKQYAVKCLRRAERGSRADVLHHLEVQYHLTMTFHDGVLPLYSVFEEGDYLFLVLKYCPGGDLFTFMSDTRVYRGNDPLVKSVFLQILDAVQACHDSKIFHRDLKPENILVTSDGAKAYLCDFGLATEKSHSTGHGCGSSYYMSPECIGVDVKRKPYSTRANDVWALGVILTSMISGHNPWHNATLTDPCYVEYVRDPSFLIRMLPISKGAYKILREIFTLDPGKRISLPRLRQKIVALESFFATIDEIRAGSDHLKEAAAVYYSKPPAPRVKHIAPQNQPISEGPTAVPDSSPLMKTVDPEPIWEIPLSQATNTLEDKVRSPIELQRFDLPPMPLSRRRTFSARLWQRLIDRIFVE